MKKPIIALAGGSRRGKTIIPFVEKNIIDYEYFENIEDLVDSIKVGKKYDLIILTGISAHFWYRDKPELFYEIYENHNKGIVGFSSVWEYYLTFSTLNITRYLEEDEENKFKNVFPQILEKIQNNKTEEFLWKEFPLFGLKQKVLGKRENKRRKKKYTQYLLIGFIFLLIIGIYWFFF